MVKIFDLNSAKSVVCKKYRKDIFKKIVHLSFSEKRSVLKKVDEEFLNILKNIDVHGLYGPRRLDFFTHHDRSYLSTRLSWIDGAIKEIKNIKRQQQIQKRIASIKLVSINNK